ncbi:SufB/SufD family protein [Clostridium sporogenes]|uniref:SufB/SufD family protein n=1 Tax=Clostridium sporogenes TaxID=1509 RepID=UPI0007279EE0|nr:SufD family Fe-S cluster assembly protein [Clostridium sporogenes]MDS1005871.1 SufD family Fe-S cluster assembly protein [Clostridium sporogenes]OQP94623.1 SUF system FeS cluster assembly SufBD [Clostridium sporogenes]SQB31340.1 SufBD protein [Clostridium sporogenes]
MDDIQKNLLKEISDIHELELGAYNVRINGEVSLKNTTANIDIVKKEDKPGIDIYIKPNTKNEGVHIPVILSKTGMTELVYNDFHIGENADITIVAGCGIHNGGDEKSEHDGIHTFFIGKNEKVKYLEKHYGEGSGNGDRVLNPETIINIDEGGYMEMDTSQIKGVDSTKRVTKATLKENARLVIKEKIFTHGNQSAETDFEVNLDGENSSANVVSRSVAKDNSHQIFLSKVNGNSKCKGHTECDAIIMDKACVKAIPQISANNVEANLIHEAEAQIINGFLK